MKTKDKIIETLLSISSQLQEVTQDSCIIGSAAMVLSDIDIDNVKDIDIVTTIKAAEKLEYSLKSYIDPSTQGKENDLFQSKFLQFHLPLMDLEVMGDLKIQKDGIWNLLTIKEYKTIFVKNLSLKIPTLKEQIRILQLFGREKDLKRVSLLKKYL